MIPRPNPAYVAERIAAFDGNPNYYGAEQAVQLVFNQWPTNFDYHQVLVKVVVLNRLYSTNIYNPYNVARHIAELNVDMRLEKGDIHVVPVVAKVAFGPKSRSLLSFASKYCSWHQPDHFQIYDSYVDWLLWRYKHQFEFAQFRRYELREYPRFVEIVQKLTDYFGLKEFRRKQIDKFLWIEAIQQWSVVQGTSPPSTVADIKQPS